MLNKKKFKEFIKNNKKPLIILGVAITTGIYVDYLYKDIYKKAFIAGGIWSFEETIKWCDETFDEIELLKVYEIWKEANPDKIYTFKI